GKRFAATFVTLTRPPPLADPAAGFQLQHDRQERLVLQVQGEDLPHPLGLGLVDDESEPVRVHVVPQERVPAGPLLRVAAILSRVSSAMISRSNWAKLSRTFSTSRPIEVAVLNCWVTAANATWCSPKDCIIRAKSRRLRLRRSTLYTTTQSTR